MEENNKKIRVRFAPSPTGKLHIGGVRTALFNYLFAKQRDGSFILRIEDTDVARSEKKWEDIIFKGLEWAGIDWDEGPDRGGDFGPYRQSERKSIYKKYIEKLIQEKKAYYCFCSKEELASQKQYLISIGMPPKYSGKCRNLSQEEIEKNIKNNKPFVVRLKVPIKKVIFTDMLKGKIEYDSADFGDIVIAKNLESPLYNLAVVIDDFEMKITNVIRGEEHIPNTPKQILIAEALGIAPPKYLHLPLILAPDKQKLSKRHGATSITDFKKQGYLPEALINFLALLGWNPGNNQEIFSMPNLIKSFSVEKIQRSPAVFNIKKLDWLNGFYIRNKSLDELFELCLPYLKEKNLITPNTDIEFLKKAIGLYQERLKKLSEIPELIDYFFVDKLEYPKELLRWKNMTDKEIKESLNKSKKILNKIKDDNWTQETLSEKLLAICDNQDKGAILWPLRAALSGKKASASPFEIAEALGKEKALERIKQAIAKYD